MVNQVAIVLVALALVSVSLFGMRWMDQPELRWLRDRWLIVMMACGLLLLGTYEPMLALALLAVLTWWRHQRTLPSVVTWGAICGLWFLARAMSYDTRTLMTYGLLTVAVFETVLLCAQWLTKEQPTGTFGHRTYIGAFLALILPLAVSVHWSVAVLIAIGLFVSCSWLAWIASAVALGWLVPWTLWVAAAGAMLMAGLSWPLWSLNRSLNLTGRDIWIDRWMLSRGVSLDGLRARLIAWVSLISDFTLRGHGPGSTPRALRQSCVRSGMLGIHGGHAHNDVLEYLYEYGALGVCVVLLAAWRILPYLHLGDPLSASVISGLVLMQGSAMLRMPSTGVPWAILAAWIAK